MAALSHYFEGIAPDALIGAAPHGRATMPLRFGYGYGDGYSGGGGGGGAPAVALLDQLSDSTAVAAFSLNRVLIEGYSGPLAKVRKSADGTNTTYSAPSELPALIAAGYNRVQSVYDQISGAEMPTSSTSIVLREVTTGIYGARADTTTRTIPLLAGHLTALGTLDGGSVAWVYGDMPANPSTNNMFSVSQTATTTSRWLFRSNSSQNLEGGGRRVDGDSANLYAAGNMGEYEIGVGVIDFANARLNIRRNGSIIRRREPFQSAGQSGGVPQIGSFAMPYATTGSTLCEGIVWGRALSDADAAIVNENQRTAYAAVMGTATRIGDGLYSWWAHHIAITRGGRTYVTYCTESGAQGVAEFDETTKKLINERILQFGEFPQDDHLAPAMIFLDDGSLLVLITGHGATTDVNGTANTPNGNHSYYWCKSTTGRIADLSAPVSITNTIGQSNYLELMQASDDAVWCLTNDDLAVSWLPLYSDDRGATWSQLRGIVEQAAAPGGGQNQLYMLGRAVGSDLVRLVTTAHPTNSQNAIRLATLDMATGDVSTGTGSIDNVNSGTGDLPDQTDLSAIYTPGSGKSCRLLDVSDDGTMISIALFDTADGANHEYGILIHDGGSIYDSANWTYKTVVAAGAFLWTSSRYSGGMVFARETHTGIRVVYSREASGTWTLGRGDSADGGDSWSETVITSGSVKLSRPVSPVDATSALSAVYGYATTYTDYQVWSSQVRVA